MTTKKEVEQLAQDVRLLIHNPDEPLAEYFDRVDDAFERDTGMVSPRRGDPHARPMEFRKAAFGAWLERKQREAVRRADELGGAPAS